MKNKDASTINDLVYYELDENADTISDSSKQVDASNNPSKDTKILKKSITYQSESYMAIQPSSELESLDRASPKALLTGTQALAAILSRTS